jgi:hypothetical protein
MPDVGAFPDEMPVLNSTTETPIAHDTFSKVSS